MNAHENPNFQEPAPWGNQSHWRAAIADLSTAIVYRPDRADSYRYRGFAHNGVGENDEAIADLKEASRLNPKEWWAHVGLADVYEMRGDFQKAEREYEIAARPQKQNVDIFVHRSNFYARRQNFARALKEANKVVQLAPNYPPALFARAIAYYFLHRQDSALRDLTSAIEIDTEAVKPPSGWATSVRQPSQLAAEYDCRGTVYQAIGEHERAIADYIEAICLDPDKASWWIDLADVYQHQGKFEDAMSCYSQAIRLEPEKQLCWLGLARLFKQMGQCEMAMAAVSTVFDPDKPNLLSLLLRADINRCLGDTQRAISDYNEALQLEPSNTLIWSALAKLFNETHQYDKTAAVLSKILDTQPSNLVARIARADLYRTIGDLDKATTEASGTVRLHPESADAYSARAILYNVTGHYDKAIADAGQSIQINPRHHEGYYQRGFAHERRESYEKAIQDFTEAIKLIPGDTQSLQGRAIAFAKQGKYHEAAADLIRAGKLDPKTADVFNNLAWLLATCPDPTVRDGTRATEYINQAMQLSPDEVSFWDTRAAVFAENEDFNSAVTWEERYLQREDLSDDQRRRATERLALYRTGKPYREEPK